jgi:hypothetical protein
LLDLLNIDRILAVLNIRNKNGKGKIKIERNNLKE